MQVEELFQRVKVHTGNHSETARTLGVSAQRVNDWKSGYRPCPAEIQDKLCVLAQLNDREIALHVIERAGLTRKHRTTPAFVAAFATSLASGIALLAGLNGAMLDALMCRVTRANKRFVNWGPPQQQKRRRQTATAKTRR